MITSPTNSKIKHVTALISSKKERMESSTFVIEGPKMFIEAPANDITEVYVSESYEKKLNSAEANAGDMMKDVKDRLSITGYETVSDSVFKKMSDTVTPQGILSVVKIHRKKLSDTIDKFGDRPIRIVVLEGLQDPGNMGTIIRTSEAAGISFILAGAGTVDMYSTKVVRSTMGSIYRVPVIYTDDLLSDIRYIKSRGIKVYAAHLKGTSTYRDINYGNRSAILIGNEGRGLTDEISELADTLVKIPMQGQVESLNASVAAALLMFEICR